MVEYLNMRNVRTALHTSTDQQAHAPKSWEPCSQPLNDAYSCPDTLVSVAKVYESIISAANTTRRLLVYSGDVDGVVPTLATRRWLTALESANKGSTSDAAAGGLHKVEQWRPWIAGDGQIGGYTERWQAGSGGGEAVFATVRGAGHMVPLFQPRRAFELFAAFLHDTPLPGIPEE
jgi:serine carboxypeptidase-like clade 2